MLDESSMDILQTLQADYQRFPHHQTYTIYAADVHFKDPLTEFSGIQRYQQMIGLIEKWFLDCKMELHSIQRQENQIKTEWTLRWKTPLPWKPAIAIGGWSLLTLNADNLIVSHTDYWHCSPWEVLQQHFQLDQATSTD
jgi:hypothetical protein